MRKALLLVLAATLGVAGVAYAATAADSNIYVIKAKIKPRKSGTLANPKSISTSLEWDISSSVPGKRPAVVRGYKISIAGIRENTRAFRGCGSSRLSGPNDGPERCGRGSRIGGGYIIDEDGPSAIDRDDYSSKCREELKIYNGGNHNLTLFIYSGGRHRGQPAECRISHGHEVINVNLTESREHTLTWHFSVPNDLRHPSAGVDAAVLKWVMGIPKETLVTQRHRVGLFESVSCPANHQRQVAITFTREDGVSRTRNTLVPCRP